MSKRSKSLFENNIFQTSSFPGRNPGASLKLDFEQISADSVARMVATTAVAVARYAFRR